MCLCLALSRWLQGAEGDECSRCLLLTPKLGEMSSAPLPGGWCSPPGMEEGYFFLIVQRKRSTIRLQEVLTNHVTDCSCASPCPHDLCQNSATADLQRLPRTILFHSQLVTSGHWTLFWTSCKDRAGVKSSPLVWLHRLGISLRSCLHAATREEATRGKGQWLYIQQASGKLSFPMPLCGAIGSRRADASLRSRWRWRSDLHQTWLCRWCGSRWLVSTTPGICAWMFWGKSRQTWSLVAPGWRPKLKSGSGTSHAEHPSE